MQEDIQQSLDVFMLDVQENPLSKSDLSAVEAKCKNLFERATLLEKSLRGYGKMYIDEQCYFKMLLALLRFDLDTAQKIADKIAGPLSRKKAQAQILRIKQRAKDFAINICEEEMVREKLIHLVDCQPNTRLEEVVSKQLLGSPIFFAYAMKKQEPFDFSDARCVLRICLEIVKQGNEKGNGAVQLREVLENVKLHRVSNLSATQQRSGLALRFFQAENSGTQDDGQTRQACNELSK